MCDLLSEASKCGSRRLNPRWPIESQLHTAQPRACLAVRKKRLSLAGEGKRLHDALTYLDAQRYSFVLV
jgi:hypothetical protein